MTNKEFCIKQEELLKLTEPFFINDESFWNQDKISMGKDLTVKHAIGHKRFYPGNHILDFEGVPHCTTLEEAELDFEKLKETVLRFVDVLDTWDIPGDTLLSGPSGVGWHIEWFSDIDDADLRHILGRYLVHTAKVPYTKDIIIRENARGQMKPFVMIKDKKGKDQPIEIDNHVGVESAVIADHVRLIRQFGGKHMKTKTTVFKTFVPIDEFRKLTEYPFCYKAEDVRYPHSFSIVEYPDIIILKAKTWWENMKKASKKKVRSLRIVDSNFLRTEPVLAFSLRYACPMGERNNVVMKNLIAGMVGAGLMDRTIETVLERICAVQNMSVRESLGWLRKSRIGDVKYNEGELINWIKRNRLPIRYYPKPKIGDPTIHKELEACDHTNYSLQYVGRFKEVMRLDFKCKDCDKTWSQGVLAIDRNMPLIGWREIEAGLQKLAKVE